ncbi:hypothetical protein [Xanthobacter wiegelii]|uniref:hypothetical protein n=1 Tax=Xanthobacter wiegelii TaxID=3119913 RepID=UPI00372860DA
MTEPFEDSLLLVAEAKSKFDTLCSMMKEFAESKPSKYRFEKRPETNETWHFQRVVKQFPPRARSVMSGAIGDLRHALDMATCESARLLGASAGHQTYFPFANSFDELEPTIRKRCKHVRPEILDIIRGWKPYKGGDDDLHAITRLAGIGKHRELLKVSPRPQFGRHADFNFSGVQHINYIFDIGSDRDDEFLFAITSPIAGKIFNITMEVSHVLRFGDVADMKGRGALEFLDDSTAKIGSIVAAIKAETIGLL